MSYPSADRNKPFILEVLQKHFDASKPSNVLEISSGTGQHISYFAQHFPSFTFQPSEYDKSLLSSISAYSVDTSTKNVKKPMVIDVTTNCESWGLHLASFDYVININMMHISPYQCTTMLFKNASKMLKSLGLMVTYGPYANNGVLTPTSNVDFDRNLRAQNTDWGVRDLKDLEMIAADNNMKLLQIHDLPSNNKCLVWQNENI